MCVHQCVPGVSFPHGYGYTTNTMRCLHVPVLSRCLQLVVESQHQRHQAHQSIYVPAHTSSDSHTWKPTVTVMNFQWVSHLWQSGCEMTLTIVSTAVSNSSGLDSAVKQSWTSSWLSPNGTSSPTQLERHRSTFSFTLFEESWLWRSWRSMGHTTAHSPARASLSWARRAWARRLLWNSSGRTVRSSSRVRQWAWGSWVASAPEPPSESGFCGWKARTMSATGWDQACGIKLRAIAARATHSLVSTILGPWEKCRMWERSCILRPSCWSAGRSLQWREILVWRVLAPKNCTSGSCKETERYCDTAATSLRPSQRKCEGSSDDRKDKSWRNDISAT